MHAFHTKYKGKHLAQDASGLPCITCDLSCNWILDHNWWETQLVMDTNRERHSLLTNKLMQITKAYFNWRTNRVQHPYCCYSCTEESLKWLQGVLPQVKQKRPPLSWAGATLSIQRALSTRAAHNLYTAVNCTEQQLTQTSTNQTIPFVFECV